MNNLIGLYHILEKAQKIQLVHQTVSHPEVQWAGHKTKHNCVPLQCQHDCSHHPIGLTETVNQVLVGLSSIVVVALWIKAARVTYSKQSCKCQDTWYCILTKISVGI